MVYFMENSIKKGLESGGTHILGIIPNGNPIFFLLGIGMHEVFFHAPCGPFPTASELPGGWMMFVDM